MSATRRPARKARKLLSPEERAERTAAARQQLLDGIDRLTTADGWQRFVTSGAWLRRYSFMNVIMILEQCPEATDVRPMSEWRAAGYGFMRKGTHKIKIWKPVFRRSDKDEPAEQAVASPTPPGETTKQRLSGFMLVPVVDVSQLQGDPSSARPQPVELTGDAPAGLWDGVAAQISEHGYRIERVDCGGAYGATFFRSRRVAVRPGIEPAQAAKTLTHELAHILCDHETRHAETPRNILEVEAESVACIVAAVCGLDSLAYSVPYVASWASSPEVARTSAERVLTVAGQILARLGDVVTSSPRAVHDRLAA